MDSRNGEDLPRPLRGVDCGLRASRFGEAVSLLLMPTGAGSDFSGEVLGTLTQVATRAQCAGMVSRFGFWLLLTHHDFSKQRHRYGAPIFGF